MRNKQWDKYSANAFSKTLLGMGERNVGVRRFGITVVKQDEASRVN